MVVRFALPPPVPPVPLPGTPPGGALEGDAASADRDAMTLDVSGEMTGALVSFGSARRLTALALGFFTVPLTRSAMRPTALGVGVIGGGGTGVTGPALEPPRFLGGVTGSEDGAVSVGAGSAGAFLFRPFGAEEAARGAVMVGGGGILISVWALSRAERRDAMVRDIFSGDDLDDDE